MAPIRFNRVVYAVAILAVVLTATVAVPLVERTTESSQTVLMLRGGNGNEKPPKIDTTGSGPKTSGPKTPEVEHIPLCGSGKAEKDCASPPKLVDDHADKMNQADETAYQSGLTSIEDVENELDYNKEDLAESGKLSSAPPKKRAIYKRLPTSLRLIVDAAKHNYVKALSALPGSQQRIFFMRKMETGIMQFVMTSRAKGPHNSGTLHAEHVFELQRATNIFKRKAPTGVAEKAWEDMRKATDTVTDSVAYPAKQTVGEILNHVNNLRWFQERPNLLKGKVCSHIDNTAIKADSAPSSPVGGKLPKKSPGPNFAKTWARSEALSVYMYFKASIPQYKSTAEALAEFAEKFTKDKGIKAAVIKMADELQKEDVALIEAELKKPFGEPGKVFAKEDVSDKQPGFEHASGGTSKTESKNDKAGTSGKDKPPHSGKS